MPEETTEQIGATAVAVFVKLSDGRACAVPLTPKHQQRLFGYITHTLFGGNITLVAQSPKDEKPTIISEA